MVYIDNMDAPYRGMLMCHMIADSTDELLAMADKIGVNRKWIQDAGTYNEHFDICQTKKAKAIRLGAKTITMMELGRMLAKREGSPFYHAAEVDICPQCGHPENIDISKLTFEDKHNLYFRSWFMELPDKCEC